MHDDDHDVLLDETLKNKTGGLRWAARFDSMTLLLPLRSSATLGATRKMNIGERMPAVAGRRLTHCSGPTFDHRAESSTRSDDQPSRLRHDSISRSIASAT